MKKTKKKLYEVHMTFYDGFVFLEDSKGDKIIASNMKEALDNLIENEIYEWSCELRPKVC